MTRIKLSGIVQPEDAALAADLGVDIVACVFNARSPRYVTLEQAWALRRAFGGGGLFAGVFVDTPAPVVQALAAAAQLDLIQLYGDEPRGEVEALGPRAYGTLRVDEPSQAEAPVRQALGRRGRRHEGPAIALHVRAADTRDWPALTPLTARVALVLSGAGITAATATEVVAATRPWAVDVWDAVEQAPGQLDPARLAAFVAAVRAGTTLAEQSPEEARS
jgi:phosphoribosylanthranilate isomerase